MKKIVHYLVNWQTTACGIKGKKYSSIKDTNIKKDVTCKKCKSSHYFHIRPVNLR
jgi:hypothetical protein